MLILIMNFGSQLLDRLEKSEKGRSKLRQAMDLVRARLDEANSLQEQLRAAQQGRPPPHPHTPTNKLEMTRLVSPMFVALASSSQHRRPYETWLSDLKAGIPNRERTRSLSAF